MGKMKFKYFVFLFLLEFVSGQDLVSNTNILDLLMCDFRGNLCRWISSSSDFSWKPGGVDQKTAPYITPLDNTATDSYYIHVESSFSIPFGSKAEIRSEVIPLQQPSVCFSFDYYQFGSSAGNLTLYLDDLGDQGNSLNANVIWKRVKILEDYWKTGYVTINRTVNQFQLRFEGSIGIDGVLALKKFDIILGECLSGNIIDFETRMYQWQTDSTPLEWTIGTPQNLTSFGPATDHSTMTENGHFTYIVTDAGAKENQNGRLVSVDFAEYFGTRCLSFWYHTSNMGEGSLSVLLQDVDDNTVTDPIWQRHGARQQRWHQGQATISMRRDLSFRIIFEGKFGSQYQPNNYVALDDIQILNWHCDNDGSCSFDEGFCGFTNEIVDDDFDWMIGKGRTQKPNLIQGPPVDSKSREGYYAYVDFTSPFIVKGQKAILRSDEVFGSPESNNFCLQFSYVMYGNGPEKLSLIVQLNKLAPELPEDIWTGISNDDRIWQRVSLQFSSDSQFEILFDTRKISSNSFIAIDDVQVYEGQCKMTEEGTDMPAIIPASSYDCNFEHGFCNWVESSVSIAKWQISSGSELNWPKFDHTRNSEKGQFMYFQSSLLPNQQSARRSTKPILDVYELCFQFWYNMRGSHESRLDVLLVDNKAVEKIIWTKTSDQGRSWRFVQLGIHSHNFTIVLEAFSTNSSIGPIAVDDIKLLLHTSCPPAEYCTFDDDMCKFEPNFNDIDDPWTLSPSENKSEMLPYDHTTNSSYGNYIYQNGQNKIASVSTVFSPIYPKTNEVCLHFWYFILDPQYFLRVFIQEEGRKKQLGAVLLSKQTKRMWNEALIPAQMQDAFQVVFQGASANVSIGPAVAVDDFKVIFNDSCKTLEFCDFEENNCYWNNVNEWFTNIDWIRKSGSESTDPAMQPVVDHTIGLPSGYFLTVDTENRNGSDMAFLESPILEGHRYKCMSFWYYFTHVDLGFLEVQFSDGDWDTLILKSKVNFVKAQAKKWVYQTLDLTQLADSGTIMIRLEFRVGNKTKIWRGTVSVDDIKLTANSCNETLDDSQFICQNGKKVDSSLVCNFDDDCGDKSDEFNCGACDFESSELCGYKDDSKFNDFHWEVATARLAAESSVVKFPAFDKTMQDGSGHYLFIKTTSEKYGEPRTAVIHSPKIQLASTNCQLVFSYYHPQPLSDTSRYFNLELINLISSERTDLGQIQVKFDFWVTHAIPIGRLRHPFMIKFSYPSYGDTSSGIALDDIKLLNCELPETKKICLPQQLKCNNGACYNRNHLCDFNDDCGDSSDELDCKKNFNMCNFEESLCSWEDIKLDNTKWDIIRAREGYYSAPLRDHTIGSPEGKYLGLFPNAQNTNKFLRLVSPVIKASHRCMMRFYYFMSSNSDFHILTRNELNGTEKLIWIRSRQAANGFLREEIEFHEDKDFQIILQGKVAERAVIAIDDISLDDNCTVSETILNESQHTACSKSEFECATGDECIDLDLVCNFEHDCKDQTDELECGTCDFQNGNCGWLDSSAGMFRWETNENQSTMNDYMIVKRTSSSSSFLSNAYLESPSFGVTATTCKLQFDYKFDNADGELHVNIRNPYNLIEKKISNYNTNKFKGTWTTTTISIGHLSTGYKIIFEAVIREEKVLSPEVSFAINNINFVNCSEPKEILDATELDLSCDFESGLCHWYNDILQRQLWEIGSGRNKKSDTGPERDHTYKNGSGNYLYIERKFSSYIGSNARLFSPILKPIDDGGFCLTFWYHIFGEEAVSLILSLLTINDQKIGDLWMRTSSEGNIWRMARVNIPKVDKYYKIAFEGIYTSNSKSSMAIDDISTEVGLCDEPEEMWCTFEHGDCGWSNVNNSTYWERVKAQDVIFLFADHTTNAQTGHMLVLQNKHDNNANATTISPEMTSGSSGSCVQFWFNKLGGRNSGSFNVSVIVDELPFATKTYGRMIVSSGWHSGQISAPAKTKFRLQISAAAGGSFYSLNLIAIDDFTIRDNMCEPDGSCDFEYDYCGWENTYSSKLKWMRNSGSTPSDFTGPTKDHTKGKYGSDQGFYLFLDSSSKTTTPSILRSIELFTGPTACLGFYYHMEGADNSSLVVEALLSEKYALPIILHTITGNFGDIWISTLVEIHNLTNNFWLQFVGQLPGNQMPGDIAIDDITINSGECSDDSLLISTTPISASRTATTISTSHNATTISTSPNATTISSIQNVTQQHTTEQTSGRPMVTTNPPETKPVHHIENRGWIYGVVVGVLLIFFLLFYLFVRKLKSMSKPRLEVGTEAREATNAIFNITDKPMEFELVARERHGGIQNPMYNIRE